MCMCVTLTAMVTWAFLFLPKLYIILLHPERNNRALFTTSKSIRCHIGSRVASAVSDKSSSVQPADSWRMSSTTDLSLRGRPEKRSLSCQTGSELLLILLQTQDGFEKKFCDMNCCSPTPTYGRPRFDFFMWLNGKFDFFSFFVASMFFCKYVFFCKFLHSP